MLCLVKNRIVFCNGWDMWILSIKISMTENCTEECICYLLVVLSGTWHENKQTLHNNAMYPLSPVLHFCPPLSPVLHFCPPLSPVLHFCPPFSPVLHYLLLLSCQEVYCMAAD